MTTSIPNGIDELTPEWITQALTASGVLPHTAVKTIAVE